MRTSVRVNTSVRPTGHLAPPFDTSSGTWEPNTRRGYGGDARPQVRSQLPTRSSSPPEPEQRVTMVHYSEPEPDPRQLRPFVATPGRNIIEHLQDMNAWAISETERLQALSSAPPEVSRVPVWRRSRRGKK
jgi:hypothetical protein